MTEAYPLQWPSGWPRTPQPEHAGGRFSNPTVARARDRLLDNIRLMGGTNVVISSNLETRRDGLPYSKQRAISDAGVAVYFQRDAKGMAMACDRWNEPEANMTSLSLAIEGLRQMERHGSAHMMERAFEGFVALPPPRSWRDILGIDGETDRSAVERAFRNKAKTAHPDAGGSDAAMAELNKARSDALSEVRS